MTKNLTMAQQFFAQSFDDVWHPKWDAVLNFTTKNIAEWTLRDGSVFYTVENNGVQTYHLGYHPLRLHYIILQSMPKARVQELSAAS